MLILKRRLDQAVQIGPDVTVTVIGIEAGAVVLGITAPRIAKVSRRDALDSATVTVPDGTEPASTSE